MSIWRTALVVVATLSLLLAAMRPIEAQEAPEDLTFEGPAGTASPRASVAPSEPSELNAGSGVKVIVERPTEALSNRTATKADPSIAVSKAGGREVAMAGTATAVKAAISAARTMTRMDRTSGSTLTGICLQRGIGHPVATCQRDDNLRNRCPAERSTSMRRSTCG